MDEDYTNQEEKGDLPDIRRLPAIESIRAVRIRFRKPVQYAEGTSRKEANEAIEFQVTTTEDFPIRALAPALFVGDEMVTESKRLGKGRYLFVYYGKRDFEADAPISIGWFGSGTPDRRPSKLRFRLEGEETR